MNRDPYIIDPPPPDAPRIDPVPRDRYMRPADSGNGGIVAALLIAAVIAGGAIWYLRADNPGTAGNPPASTVGQGTRPMAPVIDKTAPAPNPMPAPSTPAAPDPQMAPTTPDPATPTNIGPKP